MKTIIKGHWYRADYLGEPCAYTDCGQPQDAHVEACGEWGKKHSHLFLPSPLSRRCARCKRYWGHSWHIGSRKHRRLYWIGWFFILRERVIKNHRMCWHLSHRLKLPCWRPMESTCSLTCEKHYEECRDREGC